MFCVIHVRIVIPHNLDVPLATAATHANRHIHVRAVIPANAVLLHKTVLHAIFVIPANKHTHVRFVTAVKIVLLRRPDAQFVILVKVVCFVKSASLIMQYRL